MSGVIAQLDHVRPQFPQIENALKNPNGLLAIGGNLQPNTLLGAYQRGIFPWFGSHEPILWWCPDPRAVLFTDELHVPKSLAKRLKKDDYHVSVDQCFRRVVSECAARTETWLSRPLRSSLATLHDEGHAHSVEVWQDSELIGGLYGLQVNRYFAGESMFHKRTDASKIALVYLVDYLRSAGIDMVDCQMPSPHLSALGAREVNRTCFLRKIAEGAARPATPGFWRSENQSLQRERWQEKTPQTPRPQ